MKPYPRIPRPLVLLGLAVVLLAYAQAPFNLSSEAFAGGSLDKEFSCDGSGISPPLQWNHAPTGTQSFAITVHHYPPAPEAKHVYMVVYDLPSSITGLEKGSTLGHWGFNTVNRKLAYAPPCSKGPGRKDYIFTVYALSGTPQFHNAVPVSMDALLEAIEPLTLAKASVTIGYTRSQ